MTGRIRSQFGAQPDYPHLLWLDPPFMISANHAFLVVGDTWDTFSKLFMHGEKLFFMLVEGDNMFFSHVLKDFQKGVPSVPRSNSTGLVASWNRSWGWLLRALFRSCQAC